MTPPSPTFLFATCQVRAEPALKAEVARNHPEMRFAYSRPGFLTFKLPPSGTYPPEFELNSVFARSHGFSLGKATGETPDLLANAVWQLARDRQFAALHVWQRDFVPPGTNGVEPGITPLALKIEEVVRQHAPSPLLPPVGQTLAGTEHGTLVLDCVVVELAEWWVGYHRVHSQTSAWPGGFMPAELPEDAVSRGYLKMQEALLWSGFPMRAGELCIEIGSAPGGATQQLLRHGLRVKAIEPAEMHPGIRRDANFTHLRDRAKDIPREEFEGADWIVVDINLPPNYTLDTVEAVLKHPPVKVRGLLLTLKLGDWALAAEISSFLDRIRGWGFPHVRARQLHHNRQEICVAVS